MFDHTVLVSYEDPHRAEFERPATIDLLGIRIRPAPGCEAIASQTLDHVNAFVLTEILGRVWRERVEVCQHEGNSAI